MRIRALTGRILRQLSHDKRTIALVLFAPILILTLLYFILSYDNSIYKIAVIDAPDSFYSELKNNDEYVVEISQLSKEEAADAIDNEEILAAVTIDDAYKNIQIDLDGTNATDAKKVQAIIQKAAISGLQNDMQSKIDDVKQNISEIQDKLLKADEMKKSISDLQIKLRSLNSLVAVLPANVKENMPDLSNVDLETIDFSSIELPNVNEISFTQPAITTNYVYGTEEGTAFDNFCAPLIGIIVFFLVFLIAGINFLDERSSGTLEKLLSTPIRRYEIIVGYVLGFSILALIQTLLLTFFVIYILGMTSVGSIWFVLLINLLTAITALTLGILLSTLANSAFQMVQFIPLVIIPQIFLSGMFKLSPGWTAVGKLFPITYSTDALTGVMIRGSGFADIWYDCLILLGFSIIFILLNTLLIRKLRKV